MVVGIDIGSLTAKGVIMEQNCMRSSHIMRVRPRPVDSAEAVLSEVLRTAGARMSDIEACCATGYGRLEIPFASMNMSEISCHARGAFWSDKSIRTVIDIGGQDCKVICLDGRGLVQDFVMNDKCAAGTGRSLEILAKAIGVELADLGRLSMKSRKPVAITNKCSIFMELEVLQHLYRRARLKDIAAGINVSVAKRVASLTKMLALKPAVCLTGGVSKNIGVSRGLEKLLGVTFQPLSCDPQIMGALGAAVFAGESTV